MTAVYFDSQMSDDARPEALWNRTSRQTAAQHIKGDTRTRRKPEEPVELDPHIRVLPPPGAILGFSGAHLHSTVPNSSGRTRFSIDFRTVQIDDVAAHRGTSNIDSQWAGATMRDYLRGKDPAHVPENLVAMYDSPPISQTTDPAAAETAHP